MLQKLTFSFEPSQVLIPGNFNSYKSSLHSLVAKESWNPLSGGFCAVRWVITLFKVKAALRFHHFDSNIDHLLLPSFEPLLKAVHTGKVYQNIAL